MKNTRQETNERGILTMGSGRGRGSWVMSINFYLTRVQFI